MKTMEIKKELYKQKVQATLTKVKKNKSNANAVYKAYYIAFIKIDENKQKQINFEVPITDMGDAEFLNIMEAKHLIRWINNLED